MNTETGEIKEIELLRKEPDYIPPTKKKFSLWAKGVYWILCKKEPTKTPKKNGVKGHHLCLCGSGKKFRNCCRTFKRMI